MPLKLGDTFPDIKTDTQLGEKSLYDYLDFTPVCTTELGTLAKYEADFNKRNVKVCAISCNDAEMHKGWIVDINKTQNTEVKYPIFCDPKREIAVQLGMLDPDEKDSQGLPMTCRAVFIVGPDRKLKLSILYPATTGRNFDEVIRVVDSLLLTANYSVATPVNWKDGDDCFITPAVSSEDAKTKFPKGFKVVEAPSGKPYMRVTPQPNK